MKILLNNREVQKYAIESGSISFSEDSEGRVIPRIWATHRSSDEVEYVGEGDGLNLQVSELRVFSYPRSEAGVEFLNEKLEELRKEGCSNLIMLHYSVYADKEMRLWERITT